MMTPKFTGFTAVLEDPEARIIPKPWLVDMDNEGNEPPSGADPDLLVLALDSAPLPAAPFAEDAQPVAAGLNPSDLPDRSGDHMIAPGSDGGLSDPFNGFEFLLGPVVADEQAGLPSDLALSGRDIGDREPVRLDIQRSGAPVERLDRMVTLSDDGFLLDPVNDFDVLIDPVMSDDTVEAPPVMPALGDDDFLLGKDSDLPQVFPDIDELDFGTGSFERPDHPVPVFDHMLTLGDDGFLLDPTDASGRQHDHDGWLF